MYTKVDKVDNVYTLYKGDCLEILSKLGGGTVDLIITDPPYGIDLTPQRKGSKFKGTKIVNDSNIDWLDALVQESYRVSKNIVGVFCSWQRIDEFKRAYERKFIIKNILVWDKDWIGLGNNYRPNYELILLCCKTNIVTHSNNKSNVLRYRRIAPQKLVHSCEKPIELIEDLVSELSNAGDKVLDMYMGSGTTGVACMRTGREFIGIEIDSKYYDIAKGRIERAYSAK